LKTRPDQGQSGSLIGNRTHTSELRSRTPRRHTALLAEDPWACSGPVPGQISLFGFPHNLEVGHLEKHVVDGICFLVEAAELLELDHGQGSVEGVQLAYLDVYPIDIVRAVCEWRQLAVAPLLRLVGGVVSRPYLAIEHARLDSL